MVPCSSRKAIAEPVAPVRMRASSTARLAKVWKSDSCGARFDGIPWLGTRSPLAGTVMPRDRRSRAIQTRTPEFVGSRSLLGDNRQRRGDSSSRRRAEKKAGASVHDSEKRGGFQGNRQMTRTRRGSNRNAFRVIREVGAVRKGAKNL